MKRRATKIVLFLLLGAIINIAVAWSGNLEWTRTWETRNQSHTVVGYLTGSNEWLDFKRADSLLFSETYWSAGLPSPKLAESRKARLASPPWWSVVPSLPGYQRPGIDGHKQFLEHTEVGSGFPMVSMVWCARLHQWDPVPFTAVIPLKDRHFNTGYGQRTVLRVLPLRAAWRGFAIDTMFYASILWMLFASPFVIRRRRRIKRGLCPACAYPVGTSDVCTECGTAVKA